MIPYNLLDATRQALAARTDLEEFGQSLLLAVRITPTTPGAARCPACWDDTRKQTTVPTDPTCLGVGWIIPASGPVPQQAGYLAPIALPDAFVNANQDVTQWTPQGVVQYSQDVLYVSPGSLQPKKLDVVLQTGGGLPRTRRYVVSDQASPRTLGSAVLYETWVLEYRHPDSIVYQISPADTAGLPPGTWD